MTIIKFDSEKADTLIKDLKTISSDIESNLGEINSSIDGQEINLNDSKLKVYAYRNKTIDVTLEDGTVVQEVIKEKYLKNDYTNNAKKYNQCISNLYNRSNSAKTKTTQSIERVINSLNKVKALISEFESDPSLRLSKNLDGVGQFDFNFLSAYGPMGKPQNYSTSLGAVVTDEAYTSLHLGILGERPTSLNIEKLTVFDNIFDIAKDNSLSYEDKMNTVKGLIMDNVPEIKPEELEEKTRIALDSMMGITDSPDIVIDNNLRIEYLVNQNIPIINNLESSDLAINLENAPVVAGTAMIIGNAIVSGNHEEAVNIMNSMDLNQDGLADLDLNQDGIVELPQANPDRLENQFEIHTDVEFENDIDKVQGQFGNNFSRGDNHGDFHNGFNDNRNDDHGHFHDGSHDNRPDDHGYFHDDSHDNRLDNHGQFDDDRGSHHGRIDNLFNYNHNDNGPIHNSPAKTEAQLSIGENPKNDNTLENIQREPDLPKIREDYHEIENDHKSDNNGHNHNAELPKVKESYEIREDNIKLNDNSENNNVVEHPQITEESKMSSEDLAINQELQSIKIDLNNYNETVNNSSDITDNNLEVEDIDDPKGAGILAGAAGIGTLSNLNNNSNSSNMPQINGMAAGEMLDINNNPDAGNMGMMMNNNATNSSAPSNSAPTSNSTNSSVGGEATADRGSINANSKSSVTTSSGRGGSTLEDKDNGKTENSYGKPNKTDETEDNTKKGMLGDASIAELEAKDEKQIKVATGVTAGTVLASGVLALANVLPLFMFILALIAIAAYVGYRLKKKKIKEKRRRELAAQKVQAEANATITLEAVQNIEQVTPAPENQLEQQRTSSVEEATSLSNNDFSEQPYEPSRDGVTEIGVEQTTESEK